MAGVRTVYYAKIPGQEAMDGSQPFDTGWAESCRSIGEETQLENCQVGVTKLIGGKLAMVSHQVGLKGVKKVPRGLISMVEAPGWFKFSIDRPAVPAQ